MLKGLLYLSIIFLSLAQFSALSKSTGLNLYLFDVTVSIFALYGLFSLFISKKFLIQKGYIIFGVFFIIASLSLVLNLHNYSETQFIVSAFYLVRFAVYLFSGVVVFNMLRLKVISLESLVNIFILSGLLITFVGFVQLVILPDFETLDPLLGWDPHKNRLASTFFDPNFVAAYLVICIGLLLSRLTQNKESYKFFDVFSISVLSIGVLLTFSRSGWLFLSILILVIGFLHARKLIILSLIIAFLAYFAVPRIQTRLVGITDPADSAQFRLISWQNTWEIIKDNYVYGVGFNAFRYAQIDYGYIETGTLGGNSGAGSDSSLLFVFATTGFLGLFVYISGLLYYLVKSYFKRSLRYNLSIFAILIGLMIESQFINSLFYPQIMFLVFSLFSISGFVSDSN